MKRHRQGALLRIGTAIIKLLAHSMLSSPSTFWRVGKKLYALRAHFERLESPNPRVRLDTAMTLLDELLRYRREHPHDIATLFSLLEQMSSQYRHDPDIREALHTLFAQEA